MNALTVVVLVVVGIVDVAVAAIGYLSANGSLRRNRIVGIRTRATLASDKAWSVGHAAGGPAMAIGGIVALVLLVFPLAILGTGEVGVVVAVLLSCAALLVGAVVGGALGDGAARRVRDASGHRLDLG